MASFLPAGAHPDPNMMSPPLLDALQRNIVEETEKDVATWRNLVEEMEEDVATWQEIKVTALFTFITACVFILIFEYCRRKPSVAAVFDRRRATKPNRTPPPLMRSRIFEWVFLSTDPAYIEYSDMVHSRDTIKERKRQQARASGEGGFPFRLPYNIAGGRDNNGGANSPVSVETIVEEEMPQHNKKKKKQGISSSASVVSMDTLKASGSKLPQDYRPPAATAAAASSANIDASNHRLTFSNKNLNGDPGSSRFGLSGKSGSSRRRVFFKDENEEIDLEAGGNGIGPASLSSDEDDGHGSGDDSSSDDEEMLISPTGSEDSPVKKSKRGRTRPSSAPRRHPSDLGVSAVHSADDSGVELVADLSLSKSTSSTRSGKILKQTDASKMLTPDVAFVNGRRLPSSIAEYAIAGDLTEEQLDEYEEQLLRMEQEEERKFREKQKELAGRVGGARLSRKRTVASDDTFEDDDLVVHPPTRLAYFGFHRNTSPSQRGFFSRLFYYSSQDLDAEDAGDNKREKYINEPTGTGSSRTLGSAISSIPSVIRSKSSGSASTRSGKSKSIRASHYTSKRTNRHLKSTQVTRKRPLTLSDQELLRCIGLDTFVMIRFLRFGFDVTFYPFIAGCIFLMPTYYTNPWDGSPTGEESEPTVVDGYFSITMNALEPGSPRLWVCWAFGIIYFFWVLRRQWIEWETFISLRFDFLANGDVEVEKDPGSIQGMKKRLGLGGEELVAQKDDVQLHLEQYRNSCMVEFIPESHRRDRELFEFFDAIFPNQVKRAECLINCTTLTKLIKERQSYILKYENLYAKQFHAKQAYRRKTEDQYTEDVGICSYICCRCRGAAAKKPQEPKVRVDKGRLCCGKKMVKALPYYLSEIKRLNREVEKEHRRLLEDKQKVEDKEGSSRLLRSTIKQGIKLATGVTADQLTSQTGFVEFKTLTAKQSALQCNITGTTDFMVTISAPDPRDVTWDNATVEKANIRFKKMQCDALLLTGTLFWSVVVTAITSISNLDRLSQFLPGWLIPEQGTFWYGLIQGYLPVIFLETLMLVLPIVLRLMGNIFIRFKTKSETDKFVFAWHFGYRVANLIIIILKNQIYEALNSVRDNPTAFIQTLAAGLSVSSQFFLNNMIIACGTETLWELAQMPQMIKHFLMHKFITIEAKSKRYLEKLEMPEAFQWGHEVPQFIFAFLVGAVYCINVPLVIGVCAAYFYVATKVYTHQALFVYAQPYEGGGKLMYYLNRTTFTIIYISLTIFSINMGLRGAALQAPSFFVVMNVLTFLVDRKIGKQFVLPSTTLALTNARLIDEDNSRKEERLQRYKEYKAAKAEKKAAAAKDRKEKVAAVTKKSTKNSSVDQSEILNISTQPTMSNGHKAMHIPVLRENTAEQLRQRRAAKIAAASKGNSVTAYAGHDDSDEESTGGIDFYLYRQPQLNKSLWETKPRPYR